MLKIKDVNGRDVSAKAYLESILTDPTMEARNINSNSIKIRESILNFFKYRDCLTLLRPMAEEEDL